MTNENQAQNTSSCCTDCESEQLLIAEGEVKEFDIANGEISFDGDLFNKGKIIIKSSTPEQTSAVIRVKRLLNEGEIICEVPSLTVNCEGVFGPGKTSAAESITIHGTAKDLNIIGGAFASEKVKLNCDGKLNVHVRRIDAAVYLAACDLAYGVNEGNINVVENKVFGDPLIYNAGGDVSSFPIEPSDGSDIIVVASGNVSVGSLDSTSDSDFAPGRIQLIAGRKFKQPANNIVELGCVDCVLYAQSLPPGHGFEGVDEPYNPDADVIVNGDLNGKAVAISGRDITVNGNIFAQGHGTQAFGPGVSLQAWNSLTVIGTIKTNQAVQWPQTGSVSIQAPSCTILGKITADIFVMTHNQLSSVTSGTLETAAIEARRYIQITAGDIQFSGGGGAIARTSFAPGDYNVKTGKLTAHHEVAVLATGTIDTGAIELLENTDEVIGVPHYAHIHANVFKDNAPELFVGGGGNGPASIAVHGTARIFETINYGSIFITNGPSGNITVNGDKIFVTNEQQGTPDIIVSAGTGRLTVKGTGLKVDGTSSVHAGSVALIADEIRVTGGTLVSASDTVEDPTENPQKVLLVASKIALPSNLAVDCNSKNASLVQVLPKGSTKSSPKDLIEGFSGAFFLVRNIEVNVSEQQLNITGSGNLALTANGKGSGVSCSGKPLKFSNSGTVDLKAEGESTIITIDYAGSPSGANSLVFSGGAFTAKANGKDADAGVVDIKADKLENTAQSVALQADALTSGKGGQISITLDRGDLTLGSGSGAISMSALGRGDGKGGFIQIDNSNHNGNVILGTAAGGSTINVSALGANGEGGTIFIHSNGLNANAAGAVSSFIANGVGSGNGGTVVLDLDKDIQIGEQNGLVIKTDAAGSGNAGTIDISGREITLNGADFSASAVGGDGTGNTLSVKARSKLFLRGTVKSNGHGAGKGGEITLRSNAIGLDVTGATVSADGGDSGEGGKITLLLHTPTQPLNSTQTLFSANAGANGNQKGGRISVTSDDQFAASGLWRVNGAGNGKGGDINLQGAPTATLENFLLSANGGSSGIGGDIVVNGFGPLELNLGSSFKANALGGSAKGGFIALSTAGKLTIQQGADIDASTLGSAKGGNIQLRSGVGPSVPAGPQIEISGSVKANGKSGEITMIYVDSAGTANAQVNSTGVVSADSPVSTQPSTIQVINDGSTGLKLLNAGNVSALNGTISLQKVDQDVVASTLSPGGSGTFTGVIDASGRSVTIRANNTQDLVLRTITAANGGTNNGAVSITQDGSGNIVQAALGVVKGGLLSISSVSGNMGSLATPLLTEIQTLEAASPDGNGGSLFVQNTASALAISPATVIGGVFSVKSSQGISVGSLKASDITIFAGASGTGILQLLNAAILRATNGFVRLRNDQVSGSIVFASSVPPVSLIATGGIQVSIGEPIEACPASTTGCVPPGVTVVPPGSPLATFGANGITASGALVSVGTGKIVFNTNDASAGSINVTTAQFSTI
jgi:hypothetical protein